MQDQQQCTLTVLQQEFSRSIRQDILTNQHNREYRTRGENTAVTDYLGMLTCSKKKRQTLAYVSEELENFRHRICIVEPIEDLFINFQNHKAIKLVFRKKLENRYHMCQTATKKNQYGRI